MATPLPFSQQSNFQPIAPNLSVHSAGDSNISNDLTIIGDVSSSGSVTLDGIIEGNIYCTSLIVTTIERMNSGCAVRPLVSRGAAAERPLRRDAQIQARDRFRRASSKPTICAAGSSTTNL